MWKKPDFHKSLSDEIKDAETDANFLISILEEVTNEYAWYLDLKTQLIYESRGIKKMYGHPEDNPPLPYEEFLKNLTILDYQDEVEKQKIKVIHQQKEAIFHLNAMVQNTGETIKVRILARPHLENGEVVGIYGTDRLLEKL